MTNTILLVDDDAAVRWTMNLALTRAGYRVIEASTQTVALGMLSGFTPDLAIVDACLPDGHGSAVCRAVKQSARRVPVMMISGEAVAQDAAGPIDEFMAKPFNFAALTANVGRLLA